MGLVTLYTLAQYYSTYTWIVFRGQFAESQYFLVPRICKSFTVKTVMLTVGVCITRFSF